MITVKLNIEKIGTIKQSLPNWIRVRLNEHGRMEFRNGT